ncbi:tRNA pseudouridine synthase A [Dictyocaulus viviparus]|uniref:Adenylate kinase isoenzyme 6 homolog n=1 Tax=Dictyocaulus viviparus TaxID=29172 RepID=A0A0D8XQV8_DICVI|nr:tRNA pseudouridine synthase A [Dictyocaulus viviparus]
MVFPTKPGSLKRFRGDRNGSCEVDSNCSESYNLDSSNDESVHKEPSTKRKRLFDFDAHPRRKIAIQFLYYGWDFDGLHLMSALLKTKLISDEKDCDFSRCGRTDKGVSAFRQVAAVVVRSADVTGKFVFWHESADKSVMANYAKKEELSYLRMLNGVLPNNIRVISSVFESNFKVSFVYHISKWAAVPRNFSARHACNMRIYKYSLPRANLNIEVDMNERRVTMSFVRQLFEVSIETLSSNEIWVNRFDTTDILVDFPKCVININSQYCEFSTLTLSASGPSRNDLVEITICGSGFLWHMIRYIVTVLHEIGQGNEKPELIADLLNIEKMPCRPHYTLAVSTPLCLYECRFDSANLEWIYDDFTLRKTIASLQGDWSNLQTRARVVENMLNGLTNIPLTSQIDLNRGFLEFTQDHPLPARYVKFVDRKTCDSLEQKRGKLQKKMKASDDFEYKGFFREMDAKYFKKNSNDWWSSFLSEKDESKWSTKLMQVFGICLFSLSVQSIIINKFTCFGNEKRQLGGMYASQCIIKDAQHLTGSSFVKKEESLLMHARSNQNPLNLIDYSSPEFAQKVKELCQLLGIVEHPDPIVCLKAVCIFVSENLNDSIIKERNAERKSGYDPNIFDLRSFPLDLPEQKQGALTAAARILRLLNIEALRKTQTNFRLNQMMSDARQQPNILITGTPGTGKSTLGQELANQLQFDFIEIGKEVREYGLVEEFDPQFNCHVLDEEKLLDHLEDRMNSESGGVIVDYHGVDFFPERWFDIIIVLRCSNTLLYDRLAQRGYDANKIRENIECEIFGSLLEEARDSYQEDIIYELQSETVDQMYSNIDFICGLIAEWRLAH